MNSNPTSKRFWTYYDLFTKRKCHNVSFRTRFVPFFYEEMYISFFLAHPIVRFADSLQKKGTIHIKHQRKLMQSNTMSRVIYFGAVFSAYCSGSVCGFFAENSSIPQPHVRQLICLLRFYKIILQTSTYLAHRI